MAEFDESRSGAQFDPPNRRSEPQPDVAGTDENRENSAQATSRSPGGSIPSAGSHWDASSFVAPIDAWSGASYVISGLTLWGLLGWGLGRWLHIPALTGVGFITGGVLGLWLTYVRYGKPQSGASISASPSRSARADASAASRSKSVRRLPEPTPSDRNTTEETP